MADIKKKVSIRMIKLLLTIFRYVVAFVFIFSGFVKLVDPYGTAYKIQDYLETVHIALPIGIALALSIVQAVVEFVLGVNALYRSHYIGTCKLLLGIMMFFTPITLYIALKNPVQDCGCFGDALVISNWATFAKNVVLLMMSIALFRNRSFLNGRILFKNQNMLTLGYTVLALIIAVISIRYLPLIDFRPFATGSDIPAKMKVAEGLPQDEYMTTFTYEKDGVINEFTEDDYPWQDTTWHYVDSKNVLVKKGAEAEIHDFTIANDNQGDITEDVLLDDRYTFMLISPQIDKASLRNKEGIDALVDYCDNHGITFIALTASVGQPVEDFKSQFKYDFEVYNMDEITLKTMIRAYPGLMIIKDGVVLAKYNHVDLPDFSDTDKPVASIISHQERRINHIKVLLLAFILGAFSFKLSLKEDYTK